LLFTRTDGLGLLEKLGLADEDLEGRELMVTLELAVGDLEGCELLENVGLADEVGVTDGLRELIELRELERVVRELREPDGLAVELKVWP